MREQNVAWEDCTLCGEEDGEVFGVHDDGGVVGVVVEGEVSACLLRDQISDAGSRETEVCFVVLGMTVTGVSHYCPGRHQEAVCQQPSFHRHRRRREHVA